MFEKLKKKIEDIKDDLAFQKQYSKEILKAKWDIGAEAGKKLQEEHREKLKRRKKDGK